MSILIILFKIIMVLIVIAVVAFAAIQAVYWLNLDNKIMFLLYKIFNKIHDYYNEMRIKAFNFIFLITI